MVAHKRRRWTSQQWVPRLAAACLSLLLWVPSIGADRAGKQSADAHADALQRKAEALFEQALQLREKRDISTREMKKVVELLKQAAGVTIDERAVSRGASGRADGRSEVDTDETWTWEDVGSPGITYENYTHAGALFELAYMFEIAHQPLLAYHLQRRAATLGHPQAQGETGFRMALGLRPPMREQPGVQFTTTETNTPEALLNYYFASGANDSFSQMALGYRHMYGLGVPRSCQAAVLYYNPVAEEVIEDARHPDGLPQVEYVKLEDATARRGIRSHNQQVLHLQWFADLGNAEAQRHVGLLLSRGAEQNPQQALHYLQQAAKKGDVRAMAHLGHMYANGAGGVAASNETALEWFRQAAEQDHPSALYGLGYLHLAGYGVPKDHRKALRYFETAVKQQNVEAMFHLGVMYLKGWGTAANPQQAQYLFSAAAKMKHLLAMYNLAMMYLASSDNLLTDMLEKYNVMSRMSNVAAGVLNRSQCNKAVVLLKQVAERGHMSSLFTEAFEEYEEGNYGTALGMYLRLAEAGYEVGQSNAAWMLQRGYGIDSAGAAILAHRLNQRAAGQGNVPALLKLGDSAWYGRGAPRDWHRAAQLYAYAAKLRDAQASFNLGFMHQFGVGLPQDLALAKRYYDKAGEVKADAWLPVSLALYALAVHSWWLEVRPHLPSSGDWLWNRMFVIQDPGSTSAPLQPADTSSAPKFGLGLGWVEKVVEGLLGGEDVAAAEPSWENLETLVLVLLCGGLWLILWRRRSIRQQQAAVFQAPAQGQAQEGANQAAEDGGRVGQDAPQAVRSPSGEERGRAAAEPSRPGQDEIRAAE